MAHVAYERDVAALRTYLGDEAYTRAWDKGSRMTPQQALAIPEPAPAATLNASPMYPDELSEREVEVLRLVASGLTDVQVADQLGLFGIVELVTIGDALVRTEVVADC